MPTTTPLPSDPRPGSGAGSEADASALSAIEPGNRIDEGAFRSLLRRWNRHQDLRRDGADIATLSRSREVLDAAREALRSAPYGRAA